MDLSVKENQHLLFVWSGGLPPKEIEAVVGNLNNRVGSEGKVSLEHAERLHMASHSASSFDVVMSGVFEDPSLVHSIELLAEMARVLKPSGQLVLREPVGLSSGLKSPKIIISTLKLSGFVDISQAKEVKGSSSDSPSVVEITAHKPSFEVGASSALPISFASKPAQPKVDDNAATIWTLSAQDIDDDDVDLLDSDTLLDENDLKKPDPTSLKSDCGTGKGGTKKACKNCTCGMADEPDEPGPDGKPAKKKTFTSSCGSCYLGDAFRCSSCPYLGLPGFKPGEKIALTDRQLKGDL